jgi:LacI family transcriptional regulator
LFQGYPAPTRSVSDQTIRPKVNIGIREVARLANVSIGTVDRVIHNRDGVSKSTREKVQQIIHDNNYKPNLLARSLASRRKYAIAVLIPYSTHGNRYWTGPLEGIEKAESEIAVFGIELSYYLFNQYDKSTFEVGFKKILKTNPDGVIIAPMFYDESLDGIQELDERKIPYVFIDSSISGLNNLSYFGQNSLQSGYLAAKLIHFGAPADSQFLVVHIGKDSENTNYLKQRETGFRNWFKEHDHQVKNRIHTLLLPGGQEILPGMIEPSLTNHRIHGVFVTSSIHKVANAIQLLQYKHLRLVGYDLTTANLEFLNSGTIDFLLCQKPREQGYQAIHSLFTYLVHKKPVKKINHMPIDIITWENHTYYLESE